MITAKKNKIRLDRSDIIVRGFAYTFILVFALACVIPFILMVSTSFSTENLIRKTGFAIIPKGFTTFAYELVLRNSRQLLGAYVVTIVMTGGGTLLDFSSFVHGEEWSRCYTPIAQGR